MRTAAANFAQFQAQRQIALLMFRAQLAISVLGSTSLGEQSFQDEFRRRSSWTGELVRDGSALWANVLVSRVIATGTRHNVLVKLLAQPVNPLRRNLTSAMNVFKHSVLLLLSASLLLFSVPRIALIHAQTRPNIIYIMSDDMGYSDIGCYGSEIDTPNLNQLAADGLRFTQFYNTARCCPTRACLLSGLYPHQAGVGHMMSDSGVDGYRGELNRQCVTIAEVLKTTGYKTYMSGKWHVTKHIKPESEVEKSNWPRQRGFDRFYGTIHGAGSFYDPNSLTRDNELISPFDDPEYQPQEGFYYTDAIADHASRFVREHHYNASDSPFFMYVSFTAAHWPMHARERDISKYTGKYSAGYDAIRAARYERMLELGVIDKDATVNWPLEDSWKETEHLQWDIRNMEVYAAMIDSMDQGIGRLLNALKETGQYENTLILFFQDNGGCAENYGRNDKASERADGPTLEPLAADYLQENMEPKQTRDGYPIRKGKGVMSGPADTYIGYGKGWASVSNTPFREYKHWVHEGGISSPLIAHWPQRISHHGELEHTPTHLIDLMATAVDVGGADYPKTFHNGQQIKPMEGKSLLPLFQGIELESRTLFWEHEGNRAVRDGSMKLVAKGSAGPWELYDIDQDRSEQTDLAPDRPELVAQLAEKWQAWAERANVLPLTPYRKQKDQSFKKNKLKFRLAQNDDVNRNKGPYVKDRGIQFVANIAGATDGVLVAQGGSTHGWSVYIVDGRLHFVISHLGKRHVVQTKEAIAGSGRVEAELDKSGRVTLSWNGKKVAEGDAGRLVAEQPQDGVQIGFDAKGSVGIYEAPFTFGGEIHGAEIRLVK